MFEFLAVLDKLDTIPSEFHSFYKAGEDGKFNLDTDNALAVAVAKTVNGLGGALKGARKEAGDYKGKVGDLKLFAEYGEDMPTIHKNVMAKINELQGTLASKKDVDVDKIKEGITASMKGEITKRDDQIGKMQKALYQHLVEGQAAQALAKFNGNVELAMDQVVKRLKVVEADGQYKVHVLDDRGEVRYSGRSDTIAQPMGVEEFVGEMSKSERYAPLFKSTTGGGGGADPNGQQRKPAPQTGARTSLQKISAGISQLS